MLVASSQSDVNSQDVTLQSNTPDDGVDVVAGSQFPDLQLLDAVDGDCIIPEDGQGCSSTVRSYRSRKRRSSITSQGRAATPSRRRMPLEETDSNAQERCGRTLRFVRTSGRLPNAAYDDESDGEILC